MSLRGPDGRQPGVAGRSRTRDRGRGTPVASPPATPAGRSARWSERRCVTFWCRPRGGLSGAGTPLPWSSRGCASRRCRRRPTRRRRPRWCGPSPCASGRTGPSSRIAPTASTCSTGRPSRPMESSCWAWRTLTRPRVGRRSACTTTRSACASRPPRRSGGSMRDRGWRSSGMATGSWCRSCTGGSPGRRGTSRCSSIRRSSSRCRASRRGTRGLGWGPSRWSSAWT